MRAERFFQAHPVKLTDEEVADRAAELATQLEQSEEKTREIDRYAEEVKGKKKTLEGEKEALDAKCYKLGRVVRTKQEERQVECEERDVMSSLTIDTVRLDTGVVVGSRAMTKEEILDRQQIKIPLPGVSQANTSKKKAPPQTDEEDLVEVAKIAAYLRGVIFNGLESTHEALVEMAGVVASSAASRESALAGLRLAMKDKNRPEAERQALGRAVREIQDGVHLRPVPAPN